MEGAGAVRWRLQGKAYLEHDFSARPAFTVPLTLSLRNASEHPAAVVVHAVDPSLLPQSERHVNPFAIGTPGSERAGFYCQKPQGGSEGPVGVPNATAMPGKGKELGLVASPGSATDEVSYGPMTCRPYVWTGQLSFHVSELKVGEEIALKLHATVFAPGVYNLAGYRVSWVLYDKTGGGEGGEYPHGDVHAGMGQTFLVVVLPS